MRNLSTLLFVFTLFFNGVIAQDKIAKVQKVIEKIHEENPKIAISVGVVFQGNEHFFNYGNLSRDSAAAKVTKYSVYEIASITKAVTGLLVAQAITEGKFSAYDYIDNYLPKAYQLNENLKKRIKVKDLASHQSGLRDIDFPKLIEQNPQQPTKAVTEKMIVDMINQTDSLTDYGKYRYSTVGFVLLGQILEEVYGKSYEKILKERILTPLEMNTTYTSDFNNVDLVQSYNDKDGEQEVFVWNCVAPAGLIKSTTNDMVKYLKAILSNTGNFVNAAKRQANSFYNDESMNIGLGVNIASVGDDTLIAKTGDTLGQSSILVYNPEKNWGVIIFINQRNGKIRGQLYNELYAVLSK